MAQIATWQWQAKSPEERRAALEEDNRQHERWLAEKAAAKAARMDGHRRSLEAMQALMAAGGAGLQYRRLEVYKAGSWFRRSGRVKIGPRLARAWPVGQVWWELEVDRGREKLETGVTAEGEIVPMAAMRRSEADRLSDEDDRHWEAKAYRPWTTEYSGVELTLCDGRFAEALAEHVSQHLGDK